MTETLTYEADGLKMKSELYLPAGSGKRPGVLVFPEIFGLSDHARKSAARLAELGYVALACDIHGEGHLYTDLQEVMGVMGPVRENPGKVRARAGGAFDALRARAEVDTSKIAAIGFCFGGTMGLELARGGADVAGVVGFHCGLATAAPQDAKNIKGKILMCIGAEDPGIPAEQRAAFETEMREAGVNWQLNLYGGVVHSFTNPDADKMGMPQFARYDAQADRRSWAEMRAFFDEIFG